MPILFSVILILGSSGVGLSNSSLQQFQPPRLVYAQEASMEICDDFVDNDSDNLTDTDDIQDCPQAAVAAGGAAGEEGLGSVSPEAAMTAQEEICDDFIDNDGDGFVDSDDPESCILAPAGGAAPDQEVQERTQTQPQTPAPMPELGTSASEQELCDDFVDNDSDNLTDTDDIQDCPLSPEGVAANNTETPTPTTPAQGSSNVSSQVNGSDTTTFPEIVFVIVCNDGARANNDGSCSDGSQPLTVSTEELICNDGNHPDANVICVDGSQPKFASTVGGGAISGSPSPSPTTITPVSPSPASSAPQTGTCNPSSATLVRNAKGSEVTNLQNILIKLGYSV